MKGENRERLDFVLEIFTDLADRMNQRAGTLSGGEQKMLAVPWNRMIGAAG